MNNPIISVIVPVYKVEDYLHRCVDSILAQSFTDFELLFIDDGSPDNCGQICDEYAAKDSRVRVFHKENGGVSSARNLGLDNARGEWIAFIDSDDYVAVDYLSELFAYTELENVDFIITLNTISNYTKDRNVVLKHDNLELFSKYKFQDYGQPWGKLYSNKILKKMGLRFNPNVHLMEDLMFALLYLYEIRNVVLIVSDKYIYETGRLDSLTKRLNTYEAELEAKKELDRIVQQYVCQNICYQTEMSNHQVYLTERVINIIMKLPSREDRLKKISQLDLSVFLKYRKPFGWKERFLFLLLMFRFFRLYDILLHLKNSSRCN